MMDDSETRLRQAIASWNAGDLDGYLTLYDPAIRLHGYAPAPMDREAVEAFYRAIWAGLAAPGRPGPHLELHEVIGHGERLAVRFTMSGVHDGMFNGIAPTGRPYVLAGITILHFAGGRVVERWSCADMLGLMVQLGVVPPPG
jgi:predicted ester cyclase